MEVTRDENTIGPGRDPAPLPEWVVDRIGHVMAENFAKGIENQDAIVCPQGLVAEWDYAMAIGVTDE